jgi:D-hexose-6-phosphate mutarotase
LFGAVVTSWKQPSGDEVLYVRPDAKFDKSKPISGGIPFCFPQAILNPKPSILPQKQPTLVSRTIGNMVPV